MCWCFHIDEQRRPNSWRYTGRRERGSLASRLIFAYLLKLSQCHRPAREIETTDWKRQRDLREVAIRKCNAHVMIFWNLTRTAAQVDVGSRRIFVDFIAILDQIPRHASIVGHALLVRFKHPVADRPQTSVQTTRQPASANLRLIGALAADTIIEANANGRFWFESSPFGSMIPL